MTYGHLQADCLYTGISSGPNARCRVWEAFTFTFFITWKRNGRQSNHDRLNYKSNVLTITPPGHALNWLSREHVESDC